MYMHMECGLECVWSYARVRHEIFRDILRRRKISWNTKFVSKHVSFYVNAVKKDSVHKISWNISPNFISRNFISVNSA